MDNINLIHGDCIEKLKELKDNSIDSCVTDPPYELGFMGRSWDKSGIAYRVDLWKEVLRVLKPGAHLLSFGGSRTYHRMACAIEDAGFEIRDQIMWVYGSGFPKSLNIAKVIDKLQGNKRKKFIRVNGKATNSGSGCYQMNDGKDTSMKRIFEDTKGNSEYEGWGTSLKPAHEPIVLARKPLSEKTVSKNVLKWGVGGININECRVEANEKITNHSRSSESAISKGKYGDSSAQDTHQTEGQKQGRFPANFIHDGSDEVLERFPNSKSSSRTVCNRRTNSTHEYGFKSDAYSPHNDSGSVARFFYCAKASKAERNRGCEGLPPKQVAYGNQQTAQLKRGEKLTPNTGVGNSGVIAPSRNHHPTIKPISLCKYLIKLITPPNGIVLDMFAGSGSTLVAAKELGYQCIGIEKEKDYCEIAKKRIAGVEKTLL